MKATSSTESQSNKIFFSSSRFNSSFFIPFFFNGSLFALAVTELSFLFMASQLSECGRIQSIMETTLFYEPKRRVEKRRDQARLNWIFTWWISVCTMVKDDETFHHSTNLSLDSAIENQEWFGWIELADFIVILRIDCDELKFSTMQSFHLSRELNDDFELFLRSIELFKSIQHNHDESQLWWSRLTWLHQHSPCRATQKLNLQQREQRAKKVDFV